MSRPSVGGFVLPVALLCLLALTAAAHGALALARHQRLAGRAGTVAVQARLASEGGVRLGVAALDAGVRRALRRGEHAGAGPVALGPDATARARMERVRAEWIWIVGVGGAVRERLTARRSTAAYYWSLEEAARVAALRAGVEHGGALAVLSGGEVRGSDALGVPDDWPAEGCAPHGEVLDSIFGGGGLAASAGLPEPVATGSGEDGEAVDLDGVPRLGLLGGSDLEERATVQLAGGPVTPAPARDLDECDTSVQTNWGAPDDPTGPCGDHAPLVVIPGSLALEGGRGQGILVVAGDLTLAGDARFVGLALVGGSLRVESRARLQGAVRVGKGVVVAGRIEASPCGVLRALRARPELGRPLPAPAGGWIPLH